MVIDNWLLVPASEFIYGVDADSDPYAQLWETPQRRLFLPAFRIQAAPVTLAMWKSFVESTGYEWDFWKFVEDRELTCPAVFVSWHDAIAFAEWSGGIDGRPYALPTEQQWEKACRGEDGRRYPWGDQELDNMDILEETGFARDARPDDSGFFDLPLIWPVGLKPELHSPCGCADMWLNVSEWCINEADPSEVGFQPGKYRMYRGGGPLSSGWPRCSYRGYQEPDFRHPQIGFRLVW